MQIRSWFQFVRRESENNSPWRFLLCFSSSSSSASLLSLQHSHPTNHRISSSTCLNLINPLPSPPTTNGTRPSCNHSPPQHSPPGFSTATNMPPLASPLGSPPVRRRSSVASLVSCPCGRNRSTRFTPLTLLTSLAWRTTLAFGQTLIMLMM